MVQRPLFYSKKQKPIEMPMPIAPLADTHGHLTSFRKTDPAAAVARAALAGVRLLVVPVDPADDVPDVDSFLQWFEHTLTQAQQLLYEAAQHGELPPSFEGWQNVPTLLGNVHFVAGVHPYGAQKYVEDSSIRERLEELLQSDRCVGVGEFGLDYGPWNELPSDVQITAFRSQLRIAHELNLPVELHVRDANDDDRALAHADALRVLREEGVPKVGCDLHCYTSDCEVMAPFVELGCYIAFGGAATFNRSEDIRAAIAACPQSLMLSETDSPYMAPVPMRGRECEPAMVAFSAELIAEVCERENGVDRRQTLGALWQNANRFFGLS